MNLARAEKRGMYEEYWYDALGRRVLVRRRADSLCAAQYCYSSIERFAWDGDQILYEIRHPGGDNESSLDKTPGTIVSPGEQYGIVGYTHGGGIDRPLDVFRMNYDEDPVVFMPQTNFRGIMDSGRDTDGSQFGCSPIRTSGCEEVDWPGEYQKTYRNETIYRRPPEWFGSIVQDKRDGTGLIYMRNRYYDPQTGNFTQEDPIGLGGGVNLYGFAGADPINFSDPFGLCPPDDENEDDCQADSTGTQKTAYCPAGSQGTPPNCTSVATGEPSPGTCPNVSGQEWDIGQQAIALTGETEEGFAIRAGGIVDRADGPGWLKTPTSIGPTGQWPTNILTLVHSHPSGRGISPGDIAVANSTGIRIVSAGVGTNRYGSASRGATPVSCNMPLPPRP